MPVQEVHNLAEYNAAVNGAGDRLVVVDFSAQWYDALMFSIDLFSCQRLPLTHVRSGVAHAR